jgi:signal transduction histidine kinase
MKNRLSQPSLTLVTAIMVVVIAALAGGSLWALRRVHGQIVHTRATRSALDQGTTIASWLASQPAVRSGTGDAGWAELSRFVRALYAVERGLQYVSVSREGVVIFHEQTVALDGSPAAAEPPSPAPPGTVRMTRKLLDVGNQTVPVVIFATQVAGEDGTPRLLEIALRKDIVEREESNAARAIASMFNVALATVVVSFALCAVLVVWMMRREHLRETQRRAEEHLAFAGVLANGIVHDFRNPMSSLGLDVQMLHKEAAKGAECRLERVADLASRVRTTVDRMDKVFREFLYMSKPASDEREAVDLVSAVRECVAIMAPRLEKAKVTARVDAPPEGVKVMAYPSSLQRALVNVITNAEQFSREGGVVALRVSGLGNQAVLEVTDEGLGIPAADLERIFEMFYSTRPGGTGLGLFLAKTAIERCGGTIRAFNRSEGGACFRIALPLHTPPQQH